MRIDLLDHGYVEFVEAWGHGDAGEGLDNAVGMGSDWEVGIIEAARQSTQGAFRGWDQDAKLLAFLHGNNHATPFEFAGMVIEVQAPIFVFREWHRHRTQSYNEMSARYTPLPDLYYRPTVERSLIGAGANKQASAAAGAKPLDNELADYGIRSIEDAYIFAEKTYQDLLKIGFPKELARVVIPVGHYTRMRASANLRNWLAFLTLRMDSKAQWEIRQYAEAVGQCIAKVFPQTWALFINQICSQEKP